MDQKQRLAPSAIGSSGSNMSSRGLRMLLAARVAAGDGVAAGAGIMLKVNIRNFRARPSRTFVAAFTNRFRIN